MDPSGIAGGLHAKSACAVAVQNIILQHPLADQVMLTGCHSLIVKRCAAQCPRQVRPLVDPDMIRKQDCPQFFHQKTGVTIQGTAA